MKKVLLGCVFISFIVFGIVIIMTMDGRKIRANEVENALSDAIESTVETMLVKETYTVSDQNEFIADFIQALLLQIESDSEIKVNVLAADEKKGLLSVEVVENYKHPNGNQGTVSCVKTVILEQSNEDQTDDNYTITYYVMAENEEVIYKQYTVECGSSIIVPPEPQSEGCTFLYWSTEDGERYVFTNEDNTKKQVTSNINLYGEFSKEK